MINRASRERRGRDEVDANAVEGWWTQPPPFDLARDAVVAVQDGEIVGYGDLGDQANDGSVLWLDVRGGAMPELHAELERRALDRRAPDGVVRAMADESDSELAVVLAERGYRRIRASYRMGIDLRGRAFSPDWPARRRRPDVGRGRRRAASPPDRRGVVRRPLGAHADAVRGVAALAAQHG